VKDAVDAGLRGGEGMEGRLYIAVSVMRENRVMAVSATR
jgi:hypothetical protein